VELDAHAARSELTQWFNRRCACSGKRIRWVGIVALERRVVIALCRYLKDGEIPAGACLKPASAQSY
jgi:transposase